MQIFDWFEDLDYTKTNVPVYLQGQKDALTENTDVYIWSAGEEKLDLESSWSYEKFRQEKLNWFLEATVGPCRTAIDRIDFSAEWRKEIDRLDLEDSKGKKSTEYESTLTLHGVIYCSCWTFYNTTSHSETTNLQKEAIAIHPEKNNEGNIINSVQNFENGAQFTSK